MEEKTGTNKKNSKVIKRLTIELKDDGSMIMRGKGVCDTDKAIELIQTTLNNIFGQPMVIIPEKEGKKFNNMAKINDEKLKELSSLTNFINTLLLQKKIGILNKDVLQTLREMRIATTRLTPEENEEMNIESTNLFKKMKEEESYWF